MAEGEGEGVGVFLALPFNIRIISVYKYLFTSTIYRTISVVFYSGCSSYVFFVGV